MLPICYNEMLLYFIFSQLKIIIPEIFPLIVLKNDAVSLLMDLMDGRL